MGFRVLQLVSEMFPQYYALRRVYMRTVYRTYAAVILCLQQFTVT
jgi:hypothetical protein